MKIRLAITLTIAVAAMLGLFAAQAPAQDQTPELPVITVDNITQLAPAHILRDHSESVNTVAFHPDGMLLASGGNDNDVNIWDTATGAELADLQHDADVNFVQFTDDGRFFITAGEFGEVRLYDAYSFEAVMDAEARSSNDETVAVSPDGRILAVSELDNDLRFYDITDTSNPGTELFKVDSHQEKINAVEFSRDGTMVATGSDDDTVIIWTIGGVSRTTAFVPVETEGDNDDDDDNGDSDADNGEAVTEASTPEPTPLPPGFPEPTRAEISIAEQVFEGGRMLWIQPTGQIWVMEVTGEGSGEWAVYDDNFIEGEDLDEDPAIEPPEGEFYEPERGFGKLWRENPDVRDTLGWAITPEFGYTSDYTYVPGGEINADGEYVPGPGYHVLFSLYEEAFRFDEATGTWRFHN